MQSSGLYHICHRHLLSPKIRKYFPRHFPDGHLSHNVPLGPHWHDKRPLPSQVSCPTKQTIGRWDQSTPPWPSLWRGTWLSSIPSPSSGVESLSDGNHSHVYPALGPITPADISSSQCFSTQSFTTFQNSSS